MVLLGLGILAVAVDRYVGRERLLELAGRKPPPPPSRISSGDFPAGAAAPVGDLAALPLRPIRLAALARGGSAPLLLAAGGIGHHKDSLVSRSYGLDLDMTLTQDERTLFEELRLGGERGGVDAAVLSVDRFVRARHELRDLKLKAVMLTSWSRGQDAVAAGAGIEHPSALKGQKVAVPTGSPARYFLLWTLAQAGLSASDIQEVRVASASESARLLREARVDAAAGIAVELAGPARERAGGQIASTADSPFLVAHILVMRGDVLARVPDAARRLVRALLDANDQAKRDPLEAAKLLGNAAGYLGDPREAMKLTAPATLADNLAFFGIRGDAPVRYEELLLSASMLWRKLGEPTDESPVSDTRDLGPLLSAGTPDGVPLPCTPAQ